ncbi:14992_t:CDS:2, partial [Gigaspora rosea]
DITNWSDDQFSTLKETISQCIPLIRYYHIPKSYIDEQIKKYRLDSSPTIIILKIKTTNELICGYNPTNWAKFTNAIEYYSGYYRLKEIIYSNKTSNSFIFSFTNPSNPILSRIVTRNNNMAIWSDKNHGPCFGTSDLCMESNRWTSIRADYYCRITNLKKFTVEEYEVLALEKFNSSATLNRIQ